MCSDVPRHYLTTLRVLVSKMPFNLCIFGLKNFDVLSVIFIFNLKGVFVFLRSDSAVEGVSSSSSTKDIGSSSPVTDRKKHRRKKSMNQKGDVTTGQADGKCCQPHMCFYFSIFSSPSIYQVHFSVSSQTAKRKMWKLKSFGSLRNVSKTGNVD